MIKGILFDMDGVIIDSEPVHILRFYNFLCSYGIDLNYKDLYSNIGLSMSKIWDGFGEKFNPKISGSEAKSLFENLENVIEFNYKDIKMPHLNYLLNYLRDEKIKIGLASASPIDIIKKVLIDLDIIDCFDYYMSTEEVSHSKPNPEVYNVLMDKLDLKFDEILIIEDSKSGIMAGVLTGAKVIALKDTRYDIDQSMADIILNDLMEVYIYIESLKKDELA